MAQLITLNNLAAGLLSIEKEHPMLTEAQREFLSANHNGALTTFR